MRFKKELSMIKLMRFVSSFLLRYFMCEMLILFLLVVCILYVSGEKDAGLFKWEYIRTFITVTDADKTNSYKLAVTYGIPILSFNESSDISKSRKLPVILESLPYRKDDSEYVTRYNIIDYFASHGFIYAYVDIRGTGGSEGPRVPYEYSDIETEDMIQVIEQLGTMSWTLSNGQIVHSNGAVGLWGQSWSACESFVIAGHKARDSRLNALQTIIPIHCAINLYEGDLHFMDGIFHVDEYITSVDHENAIPSYGFNGGNADSYQVTDEFISHRWNAYPWTFFYLKQQLKTDFWTNRTEFFWGPFTEANPDDFALPTFAIGSLLDGYRDASVQIYDKLKSKGVPTKFAMSSGTHTLPDEVTPSPLWEWKEEAVAWFRHFLIDVQHSTPDVDVTTTKADVITDNEFAVFVRTPGNDTKRVPGFWINLEWPAAITQVKYFLSEDHLLTTSIDDKKERDTTEGDSYHKLSYDPVVGVEMGGWSLPDQAPLDVQSLVYDRVVDADITLVGMIPVSLQVSVESTANDDLLAANWHIRLEDVDTESGAVQHITGASLNGAFRNGTDKPQLLTSGEVYTIRLDLHFSTWTFLSGHKIRLSVTNSLYRMMWPTPQPFTMKLYTNSVNSFVILPLVNTDGQFTALTAPSPPHTYTLEQRVLYSEPENGFYFSEGGYPYLYTIEDTTDSPSRRVVTWKSSYYTNCYGWTIGVALEWIFSQNSQDPSDSFWHSYARQDYSYVGVWNQSYWESVDGYPSYFNPTAAVPSPTRTFTLETFLNVASNVTHFQGFLNRTLIGSDIMTPLNKVFVEDFPRLFQ